MRTTGKQRRTPGGVTGKGFRPGRSGNPGGRPKGLTELVRQRTQDGAALVDVMVRIVSGEKVYGYRPKLRDVMEAVAWLADRGFGKTTQPLTGDADSPFRLIVEYVNDWRTHSGSQP